MKAARFGLEVFVGSGAQPLPETGTMILDRLCLDDSHCDFCDSRVASITTVEAIDNEDRLGSRDYNHDLAIDIGAPQERRIQCLNFTGGNSNTIHP